MFKYIVESFKSTPDELIELNSTARQMIKDNPALYLPEYGDIEGIIPCLNVRIGMNPIGKYNPKKLPYDWTTYNETLPIPTKVSYNTIYTSSTVVLKLEWFLCNKDMIPVPIDPNGSKYIEEIFEVTPSIWNKLKKTIHQYTVEQADQYIDLDENKLYLYNYDLSYLVENWNIFSIYKLPENSSISKDDLIISILYDRNRVSTISYDTLRRYLLSYIKRHAKLAHFQYMYSLDSSTLKVGECEEAFSVLFTLYFNQK